MQVGGGIVTNYPCAVVTSWERECPPLPLTNKIHQMNWPLVFLEKALCQHIVITLWTLWSLGLKWTESKQTFKRNRMTFEFAIFNLVEKRRGKLVSWEILNLPPTTLILLHIADVPHFTTATTSSWISLKKMGLSKGLRQESFYVGYNFKLVLL